MTETPETPVSGNPEVIQLSRDDLAQLVRDSIAADREEMARLSGGSEADKTIRGLQETVAALQRMLSGTVPTSVPEHSGGPGTEVAETWSYFDQLQAKAAAEAARA